MSLWGYGEAEYRVFRRPQNLGSQILFLSLEREEACLLNQLLKIHRLASPRKIVIFLVTYRPEIKQREVPGDFLTAPVVGTNRPYTRMKGKR